MDRVKTFLKYAIWLILFFIFSEVMSNLYLKQIPKDDIEKENTSVKNSVVEINNYLKTNTQESLNEYFNEVNK